MNMLNHYKNIYCASGEVVGMALQQMDNSDWKEEYMDNIVKMLSSIKGNKPDQFVSCIHKMQGHHPPMADR